MQNRENIENTLKWKTTKQQQTKNVIARILCKRCLETVPKVCFIWKQ